MLAVISCLAGAASAVAGSGKRKVACEARPGITLLADTYGRIYTRHHQVYACTSNSGANYLLVPRSVSRKDQSKSEFYGLLGEELQGKFVAWKYYDATAGTLEYLKVIDLTTGHVRQVHYVGDENQHFGDIALNARGVAVFIENGPGAIVGEITTGGSVSTLAKSDTVREYAALGLSASGDVAYWLDNGRYTGASISP